MKYYTELISTPLAEKLKEKGMPMELWNGTIQGMPYIIVTEKSSFDWLDKELGNTPSEVEVRYSIPTFGACFDWLMERGWLVDIGREYDFAAEQVTDKFDWAIEKVGCFSSQPDNGSGWCDTWHEAANAAIEKALTLI